MPPQTQIPAVSGKLMTEQINSIISGIVGGLVVLLFQKLLEQREKKREKQQGKIINPTDSVKILPKDILKHLKLGLSLEKIKEFLGIADTEYTYGDNGEVDPAARPEIYLYNFQNAAVKLASVDNRTIDSITIFAKDNHKEKIEVYPNPNGDTGRAILGTTKFSCKDLDNPTKHYDVSDNRQHLIAIDYYFGNYGGYATYTYFVTDIGDHYSYMETNDFQLLCDSRIVGFCVTGMDMSPEIYISEMR